MLQKSVNENFETSPIVTRVTPSIIAPFSLRRSNLAESKYLRAENYAASTGCRWFNRGARSRRVRLACETEALNDSGHLSYERSAPPFTISSIQHRYWSIALSNRISRPLLPHLAPQTFSSVFFVSCSLLLRIVKLPGLGFVRSLDDLSILFYYIRK